MSGPDTPMPAGPDCHLCEAEPAVLSQMNLADYSTIMVGQNCLLPFYLSMVETLTGRPLDGAGPPETAGRVVEHAHAFADNASAGYSHEHEWSGPHTHDPVTEAEVPETTFGGPQEAPEAPPEAAAGDDTPAGPGPPEAVSGPRRKPGRPRKGPGR